MFIPRVGDFISVRKGGQLPDPFDIAGTVQVVTYTAGNDYELLMVTFHNNPAPVMITEADEVQVH